MSTMQSDVRRHSKVALAGATVLGVAVLYLIYSYSGTPAQSPSVIGTMDGGRGSTVAESAHYSEVLAKYNVQNATDAARTGETYLSVFSARPQTVPAPESSPTVVAPDPIPAPESGPPQVVPAAAQYQQQADPRIQQQTVDQAQGLISNWTAISHSTARVSEFGFQTGVSAGGHVPQPASVTSSPGPQAEGNPVVVPGFALAAALLETDIDTDENSIVEASIPAGPYAGATVFAMGYKRWNNSVDMAFTSMAWNDRLFRINARAIDKDTMRSMLSGEVNNRYVSRVLIPALALGLGKIGQLFEHSDSQTVITPLGGVIQTRDGSPSGKTVAGTVVGGVATEAGQVLRSDAGQYPVKQVLIPRGQTIGIRFIDPVFANDEVVSRISATTDQQTQVTPRRQGQHPLPPAPVHPVQ